MGIFLLKYEVGHGIMFSFMNGRTLHMDGDEWNMFHVDANENRHSMASLFKMTRIRVDEQRQVAITIEETDVWSGDFPLRYTFYGTGVIAKYNKNSFIVGVDQEFRVMESCGYVMSIFNDTVAYRIWIPLF